MMFQRLILRACLPIFCGLNLAWAETATTRELPVPLTQRTETLQLEFRKQLVKAAEGVWVAVGYGAANATLIEGDTVQSSLTHCMARRQPGTYWLHFGKSQTSRLSPLSSRTGMPTTRAPRVFFRTAAHHRSSPGHRRRQHWPATENWPPSGVNVASISLVPILTRLTNLMVLLLSTDPQAGCKQGLSSPPD